jgi:UDP-N-acetyl-D-glucosamine dehydrogenase
MKKTLIRKFESRQAVVGIVGLGYVGLPLMLTFVERGFRTVGLDIDTGKTRAIMSGESYIRHIPASRISGGLATGRLSATSEFSCVRDCDAILIAVPTPLSKNREPDLSFIVETCESLVPFIRTEQVFILESSTYPGTTDEVMVPILEKSGLKVGKDIFVGFSPEREDPSRTDFTTETIPKIVGATSPDGLEVVNALYRQIVNTTVPVTSARAAEATKLVENTFRAVNIALVNELKMTFMKMGIDIWEVIEAARTKPFGYMAFYPGPGLGGHCIPIDPFYLTWKAREFGVNTRFIELAGEINTAMPHFVVTRAMEVLNEHGKALKGAKVLIAGLAYKPNVDDDRESPSYHLMERMEHHGASVSYNDPCIPVIRPTREFPRFAGRTSVPISTGYDLIVIATAHDEYRSVDFLGLNTPILDTRNVIRERHPRIYQA